MRTSQRFMFAIVLTVSIAVAAAPGLAQAQQKFPTKPIRLVVGLSAGGQADTLARMIGQKMSESWGRPVVVENRAGASGILAASMVAKAAPDGYTILFVTGGFAASAALLPNLPFDPLKDLAGVTQIGFVTQVLVVTPALGVKSVKELIALAQAKPGQILFSSSGAGTGNHLLVEKIRLAAGIKLVHVAFKGGSEAVIEVVAGRVHFCIQSLAAPLPFIKDGKLLALAVTTPQRSPVLPDVPAMAETLPDFKRNDTSTGLLAPAGTPRLILNQISNEVARVLALPNVKERLQGLGFVPASSTPEEYDKILRVQIETLSRLVRDAGLRK